MIYKGDSVFFFVNGRPINYAKSELKDVVTLMRRYYREAIGLNEGNYYHYYFKWYTNVNYITMLASSARKTPFMYIDIQLKPDEYDGKRLVIHKVYLLI
jgi:hypothetical protein